jgi:uncharacterized surface protein with fasciclin (FAS1) repeats
MSHFLRSSQNVTVTNSSFYQNLFINTIDSVLTPPGNLSQALSAVNATSFLSLAQQVNVTGPDGSNITALDALGSLHGFTLFVPSNDAIQNASSTLGGLQNNETAIMALLDNHVCIIPFSLSTSTLTRYLQYSGYQRNHRVLSRYPERYRLWFSR